MNEDGALFDSGFDGRKPFPVTPVAGGISLESALRDFGPAAIDDLIPRVRAIAQSLDAAHAAGAVHGALRPSYVIITDDATQVIAGSAPFDSQSAGSARTLLAQGKPYLAPEVNAGGPPGPLSDQFALAAITYEWLLGKPIVGPAVRSIDVRTMPGVDRAALSKAFTRALSPRPEDRFASCADFCSALLASTTLELPLVAEPRVDDLEIQADEPVLTVAPFDSSFDSHRDGSAVPVLAQDKLFDSERDDAFLAQDKPFDSQREGSALPLLAQDKPSQAVASWNPSIGASASAGGFGATSASESQRFSAFHLFLALIIGSIFGFAAGYMAIPRALQSGQPQQFANAPGTETEVVAPRTTEAPKAPESPKAPAPKALEAPKAPEAPRAARAAGRLLVRSTPSGASVSVDGVARGSTPLALREVEIGTRTVTIARRGYIPETRTVLISKERPSRSLEVRLTAEPTAAPARPAGPAAVAPERAQSQARVGGTGSLAVESRPAGAAVTINGKPSGKTPLTINDLAPGEYQVTFTLPGYRNVATTVRVVAGERARAAASLSAQEHE